MDTVAKAPRGVRRAQERNGIFAQVGQPLKKGAERPKPVIVKARTDKAFRSQSWSLH